MPTAIGAFIFGFTDALRTRQEATVGALLLVAAVAFAMLALLRGRHRGFRDALGWGIASALLVSVFVLMPDRAHGVRLVRAAPDDARRPGARPPDTCGRPPRWASPTTATLTSEPVPATPRFTASARETQRRRPSPAGVTRA